MQTQAWFSCCSNIICAVCNVLVAKWTYEMYKLSQRTTLRK